MADAAPSGIRGGKAGHIRPSLRRRGRPVPPCDSPTASACVDRTPCAGLGKTTGGGGGGGGGGGDVGDLDALLESTRLQVSGLGAEVGSVRRGGSGGGSVGGSGGGVGGGGQSDRRPAASPPAASSAAAKTGRVGGTEGGGPRGILRKPKYGGRIAPDAKRSPRPDPGTPSAASGDAIAFAPRGDGTVAVPSSGELPDSVAAAAADRPRAAVRGEVVERDPASFAAAPRLPPAAAGGEVEGYTPSTTAGPSALLSGKKRGGRNGVGASVSASASASASASGPKAAKVKGGGETTNSAAKAGTESGEPMIIRSMGDLFNAGVVSSPVEGPAGTFEADMSFACMTAEEYEETVKLAKSMGLGTKDGEGRDVGEGGEEGSDGASEEGENPNDVHESDLFDEAEAEEVVLPVRDFDAPAPTNEEVFMGQCNMFGPNDTGSGRNDDDDGGSFFDFFGGDDDEIDALPEPEPGPFLQLWRPLSVWATPSTGTYIRLQAEEAADPAPRGTTTDFDPRRLDPPYDTSDIGVSRCSGLMSMLRMHLPRALSERPGQGDGAEDGHVRRTAEARLATLVRTFDYSLPMAKLDAPMWRVMTAVLLEIAVPARRGSEGRDDAEGIGGGGGGTMPGTVRGAGVKEEEWRYLTRDAILSLNPDNP